MTPRTTLILVAALLLALYLLPPGEGQTSSGATRVRTPVSPGALDGSVQPSSTLATAGSILLALRAGR